MDMLVKLYALPPPNPETVGRFNVRRAMICDKPAILRWLTETFADSGWLPEVEMTFASHPISCYVASEKGALLGFACYDATFKGVLGPMGVDPARRSRGVGRELALAALHDMRSHGYAYAVIGWVGPSDFYRKAVGAVPIEGSDACTGMYRDLLRHDP